MAYTSYLTNVTVSNFYFSPISPDDVSKIIASLPSKSPFGHFESKRSENFVRIPKFPYAAFGPLFRSIVLYFFTRNNDLE